MLDVASAVADFALPPSIGYVADLRAELVEVTKNKVTMTYGDILRSLGLGQDDVGYRILFHQLNGLAANLLILDEPQLCAFVVLAGGGVSGNVRYWTVDAERDTEIKIKKAAHQEELVRVLEFDWSSRSR